jgi:hypothetical protein
MAFVLEVVLTMGTRTLGVLYGIQEPSGIPLRPEDSEDSGVPEGLLEKWETRCKKRVLDLAEKLGLDYLDALDRYVPTQCFTGDLPLVGFWVALGSKGDPGKPGIPYLDHTVKILDWTIHPAYARALGRATKRWARFDQWVEKRGFLLPKASLYLTPTEIL